MNLTVNTCVRLSKTYQNKHLNERLCMMELISGLLICVKDSVIDRLKYRDDLERVLEGR